MQHKTEEQQQFKIPQTIESHKRYPLIYKVISTLTGLETTKLSITMIISWIVVIATFVILRFVPNVSYGVSIGVCSGVCFVVALVNRFIAPDQHTSGIIYMCHKLLACAIFGYLWSHQLYYSSQSSLLVLSLISIISSIGPIILTPVLQFTSPTLYTKQLNVHSVLYIRLLLPLPIFIIQLILDYGNFLSESTHHLYYIRLTISLVFLTWMFGWISTIYNTYFFIVNNINKFLFGDQAKSNFSIALNCLIINCIPIVIYLIWADSSYPFWILWIGSSITSIVSFITSYGSNQAFQNNSFSIRTICMLALEVIICGGLLAIMLCVNFAQFHSSIQIITIIDISLYVFFKMVIFLSLPRNWLGLAINFKILNNQYMRAIERLILRISAGFTVIILIQNLNIMQLWMKLNQDLDIDVDLKFIKYFFIPFLLYRSYKRSLSKSTSFSFHLSVLISLGFSFSGLYLEAILVVLFFPPFPHNFISIFIAPFTTPKKLSHKYQVLYQLLYFCITAFTTIIFILSIGMLQFSMFFGLPVFISVLPTINEGNKVKSKQQSLYQKIVEYIPQQLFRFQSEGFYLMRISKYILLVQIKEELYGFGEVIDIKGLQVQQVTSCHSKEGQTIDKLVEQTWGENKDFFNTNHLWTVLSPQYKSVINVPTQNEIQLTGIIESQQFVDLFKQATIKVLAYEISKITYSEQQMLEGEQIIDDLSPICKKEKFQSLLPVEFCRQINLEVEYPVKSATQNIQVKKKLPPIKNKKQINDDFMDLLEASNGFNANLKAETSAHYLNSEKKHDKNQQQQDKLNKNTIEITESSPKVNVKQLNASLIMTLYHYSVGKFDYLNVKKVYDLINMEKGELSQVRFDQSQKIISKVLSKAFKISIDKTTMGQNEIELSDIEDYEKYSYLGIAGSEDFNQAVSKDLQEIWTLNYGKGRLSVKRLAKAQNELYMFKADACIIKSIWNNLRFQLMYAANDNDERYSIQTHPFLMRNLWTQACEEPFGYPSFHSGNLLNN